MVDEEHWVRWHEAYEDPTSFLSRRLSIVQKRLGQMLDRCPRGRIQLISLCAGQGRDVIGVLADHRRRDDVHALLVELDARLTDHARSAAHELGLTAVEIRQGDASCSSAYAGAVPADIVMACGVFGNVSDEDIHATVAMLPSLMGTGGAVIWTRHRLEPDLTPSIRAWFEDAGFEEVAFDTEEGTFFGVGTHRLEAPALPFDPNRTMFTFVGDGSGARR
ncbi:MAG: class I SAM-dependent methyltransferase [Acidimicrobiales bacterium]